jgi:hypothetical protein
MKLKRNVLIVILIVIGGASCATVPPANTNQPSVNTNSASSNSSQTKASPQAENSNTGTIEVTSVPPGARVLLISTDDDTAGEPQQKGVTPTTITGVRPGKYTVDLEKTGFRYFQRQIEVKKGATAKVNATLRKK